MVGYSKLPMMLDFSEDSLEFSGDSLELNEITVQQQQNSSKQSNKDVIEFSKPLESFSFSVDSLKTITITDGDSSIDGDVSEGEWCLGNSKSFVGDGDSLDFPEWFQPMSSSYSVATDLGDVASIGEVGNLSILSSSIPSVVGDGNDAVLVQKSSSLLNLLEEDSLSLASVSMSFDSLDGISGK